MNTTVTAPSHRLRTLGKHWLTRDSGARPPGTCRQPHAPTDRVRAEESVHRMEDGNLPMGQVPRGMPVELSLEIARRLVSGLQDMTRPIKRALNTYHTSWLPDGREHLPVAEHHHPGVAGDPRRPRPPGSGSQADPGMRLAGCFCDE
jgi:hypothetical protein